MDVHSLFAAKDKAIDLAASMQQAKLTGTKATETQY